MSYIDENGMTAFVQQDDLFEWGGAEVVKFYICKAISILSFGITLLNNFQPVRVRHG